MNLNQHSALVGYFSGLFLIAFGTAFPHLRLWAFNSWAFYPAYVAMSVILIAAILPLLIRILVKDRDIAPPGRGLSVGLGIVYALGMTGLFVLLRAKAHFLGDTGLRTSLLPKISAELRISDYGATIIARKVYELLEGVAANPAQLTYQVLSYVSGAIFVIIVIYFSTRLFDDLGRRAWFTLSLTTSGYMLLYFGYIETYPLFVTSVLLVTLVGLEICRGRLSRWLIIPSLVLALLLHIVAVALIPAAIYTLVYDSKIHRAVSKTTLATRIALILIVLAVGVAASAYTVSESYYVRFNITPLVESRFTVAGYTLFGLSHIVDFANMTFQLFPGIAVVLILALLSPGVRASRSGELTYLLVLNVCCLGICFLFYPQLGMPRDWDVYTFMGVPLAALGAYWILSDDRLRMKRIMPPALIVALNMMVLVPRVVTQISPDIAFEQVKSYGRMDPAKYLYVHKLLVEDCLRRGRGHLLPELEQMLRRLSPEEAALRAGEELKEQRKYGEAIARSKTALRYNAMLSPAHYNIGSCYLMLSQFDSACMYLEIADGWNPHHPNILNELGYAYVGIRRFEDAEKRWKQLRLVKERELPATLNLLDLYTLTEQFEKKLILLGEAKIPTGAPGILLKQLGDHYLSVGDNNSAVAAYRTGIRNGLDSLSREQIYLRFPALRESAKGTNTPADSTE
ncbi:MAG: hypothetical protein JSW34_04390 [Candidatus Zixiibacteriota bacterium]|nr:MAG: hypothetical protein JSW34_04390 [candidate division Zixibacteria bacterium]